MKFSIIMPVYNAEKYLRSAIDSVRQQTFSDWELICVNDGSTDSSCTILRDVSAADVRIKVVDRQNSGPGAARNSALEIAGGEWIVFLDADDLISPLALETIVQLTNDTDIVGFGKEDFEGDAPSIMKKCDAGRTQIKQVDSVTKEAFDCAFWQYAYKRSLIGTTRFASYLRGEDKLFQLLCLDKANKMAGTETVLYYYRQSNTSLMHSGISHRVLHDELQWRLDWFKYLKEESSKPIAGRIFRRQGIYLMEQLPVQIQLLEAESRKDLLCKWYESLPLFRTLPLGWIQWLVLRTLLVFPKRGWVISLFCKFPYNCRRFISGALKMHLNK